MTQGIAKLKEDYVSAKHDILYRVWNTQTGRFSGWKSFRKQSKDRRLPWPWDMPHSKVEWKQGPSYYNNLSEWEKEQIRLLKK